MNDEFDYPLKCRVFKSDTGDLAALLHRASEWIYRAPNIAVQDVGSDVTDEFCSLAIYYIETTP
jgi:hypothetical protein